MSNYKLRRRRSRARAPRWSTKPPDRWNKRDARAFSATLASHTHYVMATWGAMLDTAREAAVTMARRFYTIQVQPQTIEPPADILEEHADNIARWSRIGG